MSRFESVTFYGPAVTAQFVQFADAPPSEVPPLSSPPDFSFQLFKILCLPDCHDFDKLVTISTNLSRFQQACHDFSRPFVTI
jgi:hypothetical protein